MPETATAQVITITRILDAPRELVWKAWTEPEQLACWWGTRGWSTPPERITMDVRPGGSFRLTSVCDEDGRTMATEAVYLEVVEPERLSFSEAPREDCHEGSAPSASPSSATAAPRWSSTRRSRRPASWAATPRPG
jgi:uncharacterized protein YndB with AHSA1/START domain